MRFFNRLFSSSKPSKEIDFDWIPLNDLQQLEKITIHPYEKIVVIFQAQYSLSLADLLLNALRMGLISKRRH